MYRVFFCVALACTLVYVKRTEAFGAQSPDLPYAKAVENERDLDDMVDELLEGLVEEQRELETERAVKQKINMIVLGHVASGADSTSNWLMAKLNAQRTGVGNLWKFQSLKYEVDVVEGPGSSTNFMRNMIVLERVVDFAVLLVSASAGEFEADIFENGLTRQHASLAHKLGISRLAVAVNHMDSTVPPYSQARYSEVKQGMVNLLQTIGYNPKTIVYVPITSTHADNIVEASTRMPWYKGWSFERKSDTIVGNTLVNALDALTSYTPRIDKPLRVPLSDVYKVPGRGVWPTGRIDYGVLRPGMTVTFAPGGLSALIGGIEEFHVSLEEASYTNLGLISFWVQGVTTRELQRGMLMGETSNDPPKDAVSFKALIFITRYTGEITAGYNPYVNCHTLYFSCRFTEIHEKIDPVTGATLERNPRALKGGDMAFVTLTPVKPISVEAFSEYPILGRISIQTRDTSIVGMIQSVVKKDSDGKTTKYAQKAEGR